MNNVYSNPEYAEIAKKLKVRLQDLRAELNERDEKYPHIQKIIHEHWDD